MVNTLEGGWLRKTLLPTDSRTVGFEVSTLEEIIQVLILWRSLKSAARSMNMLPLPTISLLFGGYSWNKASTVNPEGTSLEIKPDLQGANSSLVAAFESLVLSIEVVSPRSCY